MASIEKRESGWRLRYRTPDGRQKAETFRRKVDAQQRLATVESSKAAGSYVDPARSRVKLGAWADDWLAAQGHLKASTRALYVSVVNAHVRPRWGNVALQAITHADLQGWISGMDLSPSRVRHIHRVMSLLLDLGVRDRRLSVNVANGVKLPKISTPGKRFLSAQQVRQLADAAGVYPVPEVGADYRVALYVLAYCGLRWGELAALKAGRVDLLRRRLTVAESLSEVGGVFTWTTPKNHQQRSVPIPRFVADMLAVVVAGKGADDLVFTTWHGKPLRNNNFRRDVFDRAAADVGLDGLTPHELRHTAASLAVAAGANVKAVQRILGHGSAAMTLDVYSGLFDDDLDAVAERLDAAHGVYEMCTEATVSELRPVGN